MSNQPYPTQIQKVVNYIDRHLDEPLPIEVLSDLACVSKYHFHRQFSAIVGVPLARYIQLLRLKRSAHQLTLRKELKIIDIALIAAYESPEAFNRAFKKNFRVSPSAFRKSPDWEKWNQQYQISFTKGVNTMNEYQVDIIQFPNIQVAVFEHLGSPQSLNHSIEKFIEWRKSSQLSPIKTKRTFGVPFNDPNTVAAEEFRFDICAEVSAAVPENAQGVINKTLPAGRCAKIRYVGNRDQINDPIYYLYREWLAANNESPRDFPVFFEYLNFYPDVAEHEQITEIYLPI